MILHICSRDDWAVAEREGEHRPASLSTQGFVHCSDPGTVHLPARRLYAGRTDLLLLELDEDRLGAPLRWEPGVPVIENGPWFPHVYGPIPVGAVRATHEFPLAAGGGFELPGTLARR
ncbi:MAG: DUF952 domain-containing protein [Sciscionella sp.]